MASDFTPTDDDRATLLIVDDEPAILRAFEWAFQKQEFNVISAGRGDEGLELFRAEHPDVVVLDVNLPDQSGLDVFKRIQAIDARIPVVFITGRGTTDTAIEATKQGAMSYLFKPLDLSQLREIIRSAVEVSQRMRSVAVDTGGASAPAGAEEMVGRCPAMNEVYRQIGQMAPLEDPVLILGESGTGKELVARAIWQHSERSKAPFLAVNCAAIPATLIESELFGHEKGAFTGADRLRVGKFEQCHQGTLFLDEIGDLALEAQAKILRVLQERQIERVGGVETVHTDVRVIAATNRPLESLIESGAFRGDLYYRLNVMTIQLPALRERPGDLSLLARHFLERYANQAGRPSSRLDPEAMKTLEQHGWPGNVRELQSVLKQALLNSVGDRIVLGDLPRFNQSKLEHTNPIAAGLEDGIFDMARWEAVVRSELGANHDNLYRKLMAPVEKHLIKQVLLHTRGNQQRASALLGITRGTLRNKIRSLSIRVDDVK